MQKEKTGALHRSIGCFFFEQQFRSVSVEDVFIYSATHFSAYRSLSRSFL